MRYLDPGALLWSSKNLLLFPPPYQDRNGTKRKLIDGEGDTAPSFYSGITMTKRGKSTLLTAYIICWYKEQVRQLVYGNGQL